MQSTHQEQRRSPSHTTMSTRLIDKGVKVFVRGTRDEPDQARTTSFRMVHQEIAPPSTKVAPQTSIALR